MGPYPLWCGLLPPRAINEAPKKDPSNRAPFCHLSHVHRDGHPSPCPVETPRLTCLPSLVLCSLTGREVLTPFPGLGTEAAPAQSGIHLKQCDLLKLSRRQKQLCRREPGLAETLRDAAHLGLLECQFQFRHERWNCSLEGRSGLLKRGGEEGGEDHKGGGGLGGPSRSHRPGFPGTASNEKGLGELVRVY